MEPSVFERTLEAALPELNLQQRRTLARHFGNPLPGSVGLALQRPKGWLNRCSGSRSAFAAAQAVNVGAFLDVVSGSTAQ
jgi:hypothetical protein